MTLADIQLALEAAAWVMKESSIDWATIDLMAMTDLQEEMGEWQGLSEDTMEQLKDL